VFVKTEEEKQAALESMRKAFKGDDGVVGAMTVVKWTDEDGTEQYNLEPRVVGGCWFEEPPPGEEIGERVVLCECKKCRNNTVTINLPEEVK